MTAEKLNATNYLDMMRESAKIIAQIRSSREPIDKKQMAELYSIYYNAFAGALRTGNMFEKTMDTDGYPRFLIRAGEEKYFCKDAALRDILQDDYERVTKFPYEDTSESYVRPYVMKVQTIGDGDDEYTTITPADLNKKGMTPEEQEKLKRKILQAEKKKKEALLKEKNRQLLKDARGFDYDPDYDHYYSDRLPEILKELDSSAADTAARIVGVTVSVVGIICTLVLL